MEDALRVVDGFAGNARHGFFGLYDGHGGREISAYLQENLHVTLENELAHVDNVGRTDVATCISRAFIVADMDCCELPAAENAGSTAAIALLRDEDNHRVLYAANVGDRLDASCSFFILACDGVWDELEDQAAVDLILALSESDRAQAAEVLVGAALEEGSSASAAVESRSKCTLDDLTALESLENVIAGNITLLQADAFANSTACKTLYGDIVTNVTTGSTCVELHDWLPNMTWNMVSTAVHIVGYPRASIDCDLDALQSKGMTLSTSSHLLPCLAATGLASNFMTHTPPVSAQWKLAGQTPACSALFSQAKAIVLAFPACNVQRINIHAVDLVEIGQVVPWVVPATDQAALSSTLPSSTRLSVQCGLPELLPQHPKEFFRR
ncbi:hypothetical protein DYB30_005783 [Aphanomyces astaci]|uniref:PPM-type phosphatase domain-containing protein n=1 Tax=Aphanomyces astaci TaxID=112090 RepID=A0A397DG16_APHAT|nr:hypothetical protein DYB34_010417 [Aphanomyces astaci]RHY64273.1 hypothetical protein DYB30_005783 [Aphanomyces astaci]